MARADGEYDKWVEIMEFENLEKFNLVFDVDAFRILTSCIKQKGIFNDLDKIIGKNTILFTKMDVENVKSTN